VTKMSVICDFTQSFQIVNISWYRTADKKLRND
jgi:hypothetical protein